MSSPETYFNNPEYTDRPTIRVPGKWVGINIDQPEGDIPIFELPMQHLSEITDFPESNNYVPGPYGSETNHDYLKSI